MCTFQFIGLIWAYPVAGKRKTWKHSCPFGDLEQNQIFMILHNIQIHLQHLIQIFI